MSCLELSVGDTLELASPIENLNIPLGTSATVLSVQEEKHQINVFFENYGVFCRLDAHCFALKAQGANFAKQSRERMLVPVGSRR